MYYVWQSEIRKWRQRIVELSLMWATGFPPRSISGEALPDRLPGTLHFVLDPEGAPLLDCMWTADRYDLYSTAAVSLLVDFGVIHETAPAILRGKRKPLISGDSSFVHVLAYRKAVDWTQSDVDVGTGKDGQPYAKQIRRLVITETAVSDGVRVFRLDEALDLTLVSEQFRTEWLRRGLTGTTFVPLDEYPTNWRKNP